MELILISDAKMKVMLTAEDMKRYELDTAVIDSEGGATKRVLREILDEVKYRSGFDAAGERVLVQLYPSRAGGCELFVTKLTPGEHVERRENASVYDLRPVFFLFDSLDGLIAVCRQLVSVGYGLLSAVYAMEGGGYYLVLQERARRGGGAGQLSFIEEFASRRRTQGELAYIKEHGKVIAESNAIAVLARLA